MPGRPAARARAASRAILGPGPHHKNAPNKDAPVEHRVAFIAEEMAKLNWHGFISRVELAERWGLAEGSIRNYAAEAHRLLKRDPEEMEGRRAELAAACDVVRHHAMTHKNRMTSLPDYGAALKAMELGARFEGIDIDTRKVELTGKNGGAITVSLDDIDKALAVGAENASSGSAGGGSSNGGPEGQG